jgi:hypothetical protein
MKTIGFIATVLLLTVPALSQTEGSPSLQLTTRITDQKYCDSGYPDMAMLRLSLRLTYTNVGVQPLILHKGSALMHYVLVSSNEQEARDKHYESNMHVGWVTAEAKLIEGARPGSEFVVLAPRESYAVESGVNSIPIDLNSTTQFLKAGQHVFQGVTETWPGSEQQLERLKKQWANIGLLWDSNVRSEPMPLTIDKNPKLVECK